MMRRCSTGWWLAAGLAGLLAGCAAGPTSEGAGGQEGSAAGEAADAGEPGMAERPERPLHRYEFFRPEMGVPFRIVLYAWNPALAKVSAGEAFERVAALNAVLSDYEYESELSRLSRTSGQGHWVGVSDELWRVLTFAQDLARETDGAFDITAGPVISLWRRARRRCP